MYNKNISFSFLFFNMVTVDQMDDEKIHFRHIIYFFFRKGLKPVEICAVYGDSVISYDTCERWFARFRYGALKVSHRKTVAKPDCHSKNAMHLVGLGGHYLL